MFKSNIEIWTMLSSMNKNENKEVDWIERFEAYVINHLQDSDLTNEKVATHLDISPTHFYRKMKAELGISPNLYIRDIRLKIAHEILIEGEVETVAEVSYKVGFSRSDYFSKLFERKYGYRPISLINN